jgi:beta-lactam-binding protein with PASTA domain
VNLVISSGAPQTVPALIGTPLAAAAALLSNATLTVGIVSTQASATVANGIILGESPAAGTVVTAGSPVNLLVSSGPTLYTVPNVLGASQAQALQALQAVNLTAGTILTQSSPSVAAGLVMGQTPAAGAQLMAGSAVNLIVSTGPAPVAVPNVIGSSLSAAQAALSAGNLVSGAMSSQSSASVAPGLVMAQSPGAGASVLPGSSVALTVSSGPTLYTVPNVLGAAPAQALQALQAVNLTAGTILPRSSASVAIGVVMGQAPAAGTRLMAGSAVNLIVSTGPAPVAVPNVVGSSLSAAQAALSASKLASGTVSLQASTLVAAGLVMAQSPGAGASVLPGSSVALTVSSGPPPATVPSLAGKTQGAATAALSAAGLVVGQVTTATSPSAAAGLVIGQSVAAGASMPAGSAVNLVVSSGAPNVAVPSVIGATLAAATSAIEGKDLVVGAQSTQASSTVAAGKVISQSPSAGASVAAHSAVNVVLSSGPAPVQVSVPALEGLAESAATTALTKAGLAAGAVTSQASASVAAGKILSQSPAAGTKAAKGSSVSLVMSTGPALVTTPKVVGLTKAAAIAALQSAGESLGAVTTAANSLPSGEVISQTPAANTQEAKGTAVRLIISTGPPK